MLCIERLNFQYKNIYQITAVQCAWTVYLPIYKVEYILLYWHYTAYTTVIYYT